MGAISALYIKSIDAFEDLFEKRVAGNYYVRHMLGMLFVGIMMHVLITTAGHYYIEGVAYATVEDVLSGKLTSLYLLLLLFVLKLLSTSLTLGSRASGGIFSPSLYMGATSEQPTAYCSNGFFPLLPSIPPLLPSRAWPGTVGGATSAALTAIVMIFEMILD